MPGRVRRRSRSRSPARLPAGERFRLTGLVHAALAPLLLVWATSAPAAPSGARPAPAALLSPAPGGSALLLTTDSTGAQQSSDWAAAGLLALTAGLIGVGAWYLTRRPARHGAPSSSVLPRPRRGATSHERLQDAKYLKLILEAELNTASQPDGSPVDPSAGGRPEAGPAADPPSAATPPANPSQPPPAEPQD